MIDAPSLDGMTEKTDKTRDSPISVRIPTDRQAEFRRRVEQSGLSTNAYINRAILNAPIPRGARKPPVEKQMLAELLARAGMIHDDLDKAARIDAENPDTAQAVKAGVAELEIIAAGVLKLMERGR